MSVLSEHLKELRGGQSQAVMANALGIKYQQWAKYERGEVSPGADMLKQICLVHACSADWLLGLPERGGSVTAHGAHSIAADAHANVNTGGDCSKCKLLQAHIKEITGRK